MNADASKAPSQRINVRHISDPFSRGNTRGGPHSIIHRHSRAVAFSIFRKYGLFGRTQHKDGKASFHVHTSGTILLATMDVQAQFTSTRTTSQLNTHNLLNEGGSSGRGSEKERRTRDRPSEKEKTKEKKPGKPPGTSGSSSQTTSVGSVVSSSRASRTTTDEDVPMKISTSSPTDPTSPTIASTASTYAASISSATLAARDSMDTRSPASSMDGGHTLTVPLRDLDGMDLDDDDDDYRRSVQRTSHAEAFQALDSHRIEAFRGQTSHHGEERKKGGLGRFLGFNGRSSAGKSAGPSDTVLMIPTTPPWLTLAPRHKQEEQERVIHNLNESFKDVGLLPTYRQNRGERSKGKKPMRNRAGVNVFEQVPPDALHMLLPLWPGHTDDASAVRGEAPMEYAPPTAERQYLIVYYIPFEREVKDKGKKGEANKKRARADSLSVAGAGAAKAKGIPRGAFRVCARLVSYDDFLDTGVRLPSEGLTVTGPVADALAALPATLLHEFPSDVVIGMCSGRDRDIEFLPDGLAKVGLCRAVVEEHHHAQPPSPVHEEEMMDEFDPVYSLTPIGRAAVEMAWLGCLAITFSELNPPAAK